MVLEAGAGCLPRRRLEVGQAGKKQAGWDRRGQRKETSREGFQGRSPHGHNAITAGPMSLQNQKTPKGRSSVLASLSVSASRLSFWEPTTEQPKPEDL